MSAGEQVADLCRQLDVKVREYEALTAARANAEVDYKASRAKRILRAKLEGAKSVAEAEMVAAADPTIEDLWRKHLIADGVADAAQKQIMALRERIGFGRSVMATDRAADLLGAQAGGAS